MKLKIFIILEVVITFAIICLFSLFHKQFILPQIEYMHFLQKLPGKYINEEPYLNDCGDFIICELAEHYRLHIENHKNFSEIYECEASATPCYVSVKVFILSDNLAISLGYNDEVVENGVPKIFVTKSLLDNLNVTEKQIVLLKSVANAINVEIFDIIPYSGFPEYVRLHSPTIFLIASQSNLHKIGEKLFSINSKHINSSQEFNLLDLYEKARLLIIFFYIVFSFFIFLWILCVFICKWRILNLTKYFSHLYLLAVPSQKICIRKLFFCLSETLFNVLVGGTISITVGNISFLKIYLISVLLCSFCFLSVVVLKNGYNKIKKC